MTLPAGWRRIDLSAGDLETVLDTIQDPQLRQLLRGPVGGMLAAGVKFIAFRTADLSTSFATNVNIVSAPSGGLSLDVLEQLNVAQLEQLDVLEGEVGSERVQLAAGEALHLSYRLSEAAAGNPYVVEQYVIPAGRTYHVVTVSGLTAEDIAADAEAMAESFEILD